jgi:hypothetical protein
MDNTAVQANEPIPRIPPAESTFHDVSRPKPSVRRRHPVRRILDEIAALRITVVLFALAIIIVFCGTLAQRDAGVWTVVKHYFRSAFVWIPLKNLVFVDVPGRFPFPGGWLIGALLLINLVAAHAVRFRMTWKRPGIVLLHAGLIVMMLGELFTGLWAVEGHMTITQGSSVNYVEHQGKNELAILTPEKAGTDVIAVPQSHLKKGATITHEALPFDIHVGDFMVNSQLYKLPGAPLEFTSLAASEYLTAPAGASNPADSGLGKTFYIAQEQPEVSGVEEQKVDLASAYVTLRRKDNGESLGTYLVSLHLSLFGEQPQVVTVDGKKYEIALRFERSYKPYSIHLIEFRHDKYKGTETPKNFSSRVRLVDPSTQENREVLISMNDPLRYRGETFYQASFRGSTVTVLQVVDNPAWLFPYVSCIMVTLGMLIHFMMHLVVFLSRRA